VLRVQPAPGEDRSSATRWAVAVLRVRQSASGGGERPLGGAALGRAVRGVLRDADAVVPLGPGQLAVVVEDPPEVAVQAVALRLVRAVLAQPGLEASAAVLSLTSRGPEPEQALDRVLAAVPEPSSRGEVHLLDPAPVSPAPVSPPVPPPPATAPSGATPKVPRRRAP